jgi:hypothetical protein
VGPDPPAEGDGYTYEHLAGRPEAWLDFMADTGDGGNPTYAVARSLAAPELPVQTPSHLVAPHPTDYSEGDTPRNDNLICKYLLVHSQAAAFFRNRPDFLPAMPTKSGLNAGYAISWLNCQCSTVSGQYGEVGGERQVC